ncbi:MAG: hypothetical protein DMD81_14520, partial [Candidatus Rokuibacteriota bacterium]
MAATDALPRHLRRRVTRREFLDSVAWGGVAGGVFLGAHARKALAAAALYPDWIPASPKLPRRGGTLTRASAWDPPVIDPRLTQSIGLFQFAGLTSNRLLRHVFVDEATGYNDLTLKGDLAESWQASSDQRVWTFKLR